MTATHAPTAPLGLTLQSAASALWLRLVATALIAAALAGAGVLLALSLPHSQAAPPATFLGPTSTAPQP